MDELVHQRSIIDTFFNAILFSDFSWKENIILCIWLRPARPDFGTRAIETQWTGLGTGSSSTSRWDDEEEQREEFASTARLRGRADRASRRLRRREGSGHDATTSSRNVATMLGARAPKPQGLSIWPFHPPCRAAADPRNAHTHRVRLPWRSSTPASDTFFFFLRSGI
jgi:hypothetical protein